MLNKLLGVLVLIAVGLIIYVIVTSGSERQARIDQATSPAELAQALLGSDNGKAEATFDKGVLNAQLTLDAVLSASSAVSGFNLQIVRMVPEVFKKFPDVSSIVLHESGPFHDIRGNKSTEEMLRIAFTRDESDSVHWDNINYDDVPKLGEHYWMHPALRRALQ